MDRGFLYFFSGGKHAVQLAVSLRALRQFHSEPARIAVGDDEGEQFADMLAQDERLNCTVERIDMLTKQQAGGKARHHSSKARMADWTPFEQTIFLDADTLPAKELVELWPKKEEVVLTSFAGWLTTGGTMKRRLGQYRQILPGPVAMMRARAYPAINTGVMSWDKRATGFHRKWREAVEKHPVFMGDEIVANLIFPEFPHRVLSDSWNYSPVYSAPLMGGPHVWHFHGGKHLREGQARNAWLPAYEQTVADNIGGIKDWTPARDKSLRRFLEESR
jgi:hypothetical protein